MSDVLVLVTGTGRSGTSTVSGTLHHLGLHVPGPYLGANRSNPKGFFESTWALHFHKGIQKRAGIEDFDGRPEAIELAHRAVTEQDRDRLRAWLSEQHGTHPQIVVKDPRSVWAQRLWRDVASEVGLSIRYLSMLRHPAEVVGSRATYYAKDADAERRRSYEIASIARWVNSSLVSERETRGERRTFVPYAELLQDWRAVMGRVGRELGLSYDGDLSGPPHPVDEFIDPDLRRVRVGWDDLAVPAPLQQVAQQVWDCLGVLSTSEGAESTASARLDALSEDYARLYVDSRAICIDAVDAARRSGRREGARRGRQRERDAQAASSRGPQADAASSAAGGRPVSEVSGRDLARELGRRVAGRAPRLRSVTRGSRRRSDAAGR